MVPVTMRDLFLGRLQHVAAHLSGRVASRSACAWSGSIRTCASWARCSTWSSPCAAMPDRNRAPRRRPSRSVGEAQVAERVAHDRFLACQVPCGMATPSPDVRRDRALALEHRVDVRRLDRTRRDQRLPAARIASSLLRRTLRRAGSPRSSSSSASEREPAPSAIDRAAVLHRVDDLRDGGVAEEHLERDDRLRPARPHGPGRPDPRGTTTTSASSGIEFTGVCSTVTPLFFSCPRRVLASMTLLPIPASHATTSLGTSLPSMLGTGQPPWLVAVRDRRGRRCPSLCLGGRDSFLGLGQLDVGQTVRVVAAPAEAEQSAPRRRRRQLRRPRCRGSLRSSRPSPSRP